MTIKQIAELTNRSERATRELHSYNEDQVSAKLDQSQHMLQNAIKELDKEREARFQNADELHKVVIKNVSMEERITELEGALREAVDELEMISPQKGFVARLQAILEGKD